MTDDVFTQDQGGEDESALDALVGEGKKFSDVESLAKGKQESDAHIARLEAEAAEMRTQLEQADSQETTEATLAELIKVVRESTGAKEGSEDAGNQLSPEELQETVRSILAGEKVADTKASNRAQGNKLVLSKVDGNVEAAKALVAERAAQHGMTAAQLADLSETSPSAFARLMEIEPSTSSPGTAGLPGVNTGANTSGHPLEVEGFKTKAWFDAKRKEMGTKAFINDSNLQSEMLKSAEALGERFNQ